MVAVAVVVVSYRGGAPVSSRRESYRGSGGAVRVVLRLVRTGWRGREGTVALEVTRPEEKVGVAGVTTGGSSWPSTTGLGE